ncbi:MAG: hypothetical protein IKM13_01920 [Clostridia bacterium]|nr:hypothetical protein [Clostridia bacterium]
MFCKWCGGNLAPADTKCSRCGKEVPALSDCGGFYDLVPDAPKVRTADTTEEGTEMQSVVEEENVDKQTSKMNTQIQSLPLNTGGQKARLALLILTLAGVVLAIMLLMDLTGSLKGYATLVGEMKIKVDHMSNRISSLETLLTDAEQETEAPMESETISPEESDAVAPGESEMTSVDEGQPGENETGTDTKVLAEQIVKIDMDDVCRNFKTEKNINMSHEMDVEPEYNKDKHLKAIDFILCEGENQAKLELFLDYRLDIDTQDQEATIRYNLEDDTEILGDSKNIHFQWKYRTIRKNLDIPEDSAWIVVPKIYVTTQAPESSMKFSETELVELQGEQVGALEFSCVITRTNKQGGTLIINVEGIQLPLMLGE